MPDDYKTTNAKIQAIARRKSGGGDNAIEVTCVTDDNQWIRDWIGFDKAPDFVWERWAHVVDPFVEGQDAKDILRGDGAFDLIGKTVELACEAEDYKGKTYLRVRRVRAVLPSGEIQEPVVSTPVLVKLSDVKCKTATSETRPTHRSLTDEEIPF